MVDDGTLDRRRGSLNVDDEGTPTQCTVLIENGVLKGYIQDKLNARLMGMPATGNGRRESFAHMTLPRMTNTYMRAGSRPPEEIIASVKKGLYAVNFGGGQVDITSGKFVFSASEAYLIENGKIGAPVKGATLIGNGPDVLTRVSMVGNDMRLDGGVGTCGKEGQSVPVGVGQPTLRIDALTVGGRASGLTCSGPGLRYRLRSFSSERSHEISAMDRGRHWNVLRNGVRLVGRTRSRRLSWGFRRTSRRRWRESAPDRIRAHVQFLADDLLEGRGTGTRGGDIAAHYIATQFALYGLKPAGDDGGYLQRVDFTGVQTQDGTTASLVPARGSPEDLTRGTDYVVGNQTQTDSVDIDAPIVFAGYGIDAPEYRWDDFKGVDVKGKVILVIVNEPPSKDPKFFAGETMTYYGRWTYKFEEAARKGAHRRAHHPSHGPRQLRLERGAELLEQRAWCTSPTTRIRSSRPPPGFNGTWRGGYLPIPASSSTTWWRSPERASSRRGNCRCGSRLISRARCASSSPTTCSPCSRGPIPAHPPRP